MGKYKYILKFYADHIIRNQIGTFNNRINIVAPREKLCISLKCSNIHKTFINIDHVLGCTKFSKEKE